MIRTPTANSCYFLHKTLYFTESLPRICDISPCAVPETAKVSNQKLGQLSRREKNVMRFKGLFGLSAKKAPAVLAAAAMLFASSAAFASHQWGSYHFERDGVDTLTLSIGNNHDAGGTPNWSAILGDVVADWGNGTGGYGGAHFDTVGTSGGSGNIESYNDNYGDNGWLGLARIWITRGKNKHITRGEALVNDSYVTLAGYDGFDQPVEWEQVMCQEIGHTFGLDHNNEGSVGGTPDDTCMNTDIRPLRYPTPNIHDTEMFDSDGMYAHDHGDGGGGGGEPKKCHPVFGCPGAPGLGHAVWAEHYETDEEMFDAADAVVDATVLSSGFDRMVGQAASAVPVTPRRAQGHRHPERLHPPGHRAGADPRSGPGDRGRPGLRDGRQLHPLPARDRQQHLPHREPGRTHPAVMAEAL